MRMSICTGGYTRFFIRDLCEAIDYYADLGYTAFDLGIDGGYDAALLDEKNWKMAAKRVKTRLEMRGLVIAQAHAPGVWYVDDATEEYDKLMRQSIRVCNYFGTRSLVVHMMHVHDCTPETFAEQNAEYFSRFLPDLEEYNVDFCFENLGGFTEKDMYCGTADELLAVINRMNNKHIRACWDTGHANTRRLDQYENVMKLKGLLGAVHIHDNLYPFKEPDGLFTPDAHNFPLFGNVNFDAFIQALLDINYDGAFSIETDTPNRRGHIDFFKDGELTLNLKPIPFKIRRMADEMLAEIGKYMMKTYGLWEGDK